MKSIKSICKIVIILSIIFFLNSCDKKNDSNAYKYQYAIPIQTDDGWETESASDVGINTNDLQEMMQYLHNIEHFIHSILIVKNGKLVFEEYFSGRQFDLTNNGFTLNEGLNYEQLDFDLSTLHYCASASKSITSLLVGIAIDKGYITDTEDLLFSYFPDYIELENEKNSGITLKNLLTMTAGLTWDDGSYPMYDIRNDEANMFTNEDPVEFVLSMPVNYIPGTDFAYHSGLTLLLGEIVHRQSGMLLTEFAEQFLFGPLDINEYAWAVCEKDESIAFASGGLYLRPRDMAKMGQLLITGGLWKNEQIVSQVWINESMAESWHFTPDNHPHPYIMTGYGYQWWIGQFSTNSGSVDAIIAAGWGGQFIFVIPESDMVIVTTAGDYEAEDYEFIINTIIGGYLL